MHCVVIRHIDSGTVKTLVQEEITKENIKHALRKCTELIGHNIVQFDMPVLKLYGVLDYEINYPSAESVATLFGRNIKITDTLLLSKLLNADRFGGHSLEAWGKRLGNYKIDFNEWDKYSEEMLEYCIQDTEVNKEVYFQLLEEQGDTDLTVPYSLEVKLYDLGLKRELFGFHFDKDLAQECLVDLTGKMQEIALKVNPLLPAKKMSKGEASQYIPPKVRFKKDGSVSAHMQNFLNRIGAVLVPGNDHILFMDKLFDATTEEPLLNSTTATIEDIDVVKGYLLSLGWVPSEVKERDITKNTDKTVKNYNQIVEAIDRYVAQTLNSPFKDLRLDLLETSEKLLRNHLLAKLGESKPQIKFGKLQAQKPIFLPTSPKLTVGVEKEICPNLIALGEKAEFVSDVVKYYTYRHRKNSIAGGVLDEDGEPVTGFLSAVREDGRIPTPSDTLGANTGRYRHKVVCNIPRVTSVYGDKLRALFGSGPAWYQLGFDFASLEARIMGHYVIPYKDGQALAEALVAEKPNDIHSINARKLGIDRSAAKSFSYACLPLHTKVLTPTGWKLHCELNIGDEILSFNADTDQVELDTIQKVHYFNDKEVYRFSNKRDSFECTEDHRWYGYRRSRGRKASKKIFGFFEAKEFTQEHNIILTAPYVGGNAKVTPEQAKLMGYILSDGAFKWSKRSEATSCSKGKRKGVRLQISQSLNKFHNEIETLLVRLDLPFHKTENKKPNGNSCFNWVIGSAAARKFLDEVVKCRKDKHEVNWVEWVCSLSKESLESFYQGFYNGDGDLTERHEVITQNVGPIHEAIVTAAQLLGKGRVSLNKHSGTNTVCQGIRVQKKRHMTMQEQTKTNLGVQDTFCLTTENSSFIIWQDDFIGITGNCIYGAQPKKLAKMLGVTENQAKDLFANYWDAVPALKELKQEIEKEWERSGKKYIKGLDGRLLQTRSKHSLINVLFQSGGAIAAKWTTVLLAQHLEAANLLGNPFEHTTQDVKVWLMQEMHDEVQMAVHPRLLKITGGFATEDAAKEFAKMHSGGSAVGHGTKGFYVGLKTKPVEAIESSIDKVCRDLALQVQLGFEWIPGRNWAQCH